MRCPNCDRKVSARMKFCPECSQPLGLPETPDASATPQVTVAQEIPQENPQETVPVSRHHIYLHPTLHFILRAVLAVLLTIAVAISVFFTIKYYTELHSNQKPEVTKSASIRNATVFSSFANPQNAGEKIYRITFYLSEGKSLLVSIPPFSQEYPIEKGKPTVVDLTLADIVGTNIPNTNSAKYHVDARVKLEDGSYELVPVDDIEVFFNKASFAILSPSEFAGAQTITSYLDIVPLRFKVDSGSSVTINGENISPRIDEFGLCDVNLPVVQGTNNQYVIQVSHANFLVNTIKLMVQSPNNPFAIKIDQIGSAQINIPSGTHPLVPPADILITGKTEPESAMTVNLPGSYVELDQQTGAFRIRCHMTEYGSQQLSIVVNKGTEQARIDRMIDYYPSLDYYSKHAQAFNQQLVSNPNAFKDITFSIPKGFVNQIMLYNNEKLYQINVGSISMPALVMIRYEGSAKMEKGKTYHIFADVTGTTILNDKEYPLLTARYVYPN